MVQRQTPETRYQQNQQALGRLQLQHVGDATNVAPK